MQGTCTDLLKYMDESQVVDGYKVRPTYHVTSMFIGKDTHKMDSDLFKSFHDGQLINIPVRALLFVPGKIMTAVCFLDVPIENKMPHMTLLLGKWPAKESNTALEATCLYQHQAFYDLYQKARSGESRGSANFKKGIKISKDTVEAYFLVL
jgi:hypothetical protein